MEQDLLDYQPIDYASWETGDGARRFNNLRNLKLINSLEDRIAIKSVPYQDQRDDPGQAELVTYFSIKLMELTELGNRDIVVPTCITHDLGFDGFDKNLWKQMVEEGKTSGIQARLPHQLLSCYFIGLIIGPMSEYSHVEKKAMVSIAGDHDTRELSIESHLEDSRKIMWDSDILWRVTEPHSNVPSMEKYSNDPKTLLDRIKHLSTDKEGIKKLSSVAEKVARIEIANTLTYKFGDDGFEVLYKEGFENEASIIKNSFNLS